MFISLGSTRIPFIFKISGIPVACLFIHCEYSVITYHAFGRGVMGPMDPPRESDNPQLTAACPVALTRCRIGDIAPTPY